MARGRLTEFFCHNDECRKGIGVVDNFYCADCWEEMIDYLCDQIDGIGRRAERFYIGQTCSPARRALQHFARVGRRSLTILYWSEERRETMALEETLIGCYEHVDERENIDSDSGGNWSERHDWNCVYVSWEERPSRRASAEKVQLISSPDDSVAKKGKRLFDPKPIYLAVDPQISQADARSMVRR